MSKGFPSREKQPRNNSVVGKRQKRLKHIAADLAKGRIPSVLTRNADGQLVTTFFCDCSKSVWQSAVEDADEGNFQTLIRLLMTEELLTEEGRALISDLLDRHQPLDQTQLSSLERWPIEYRRQLAIIILTNGGLKRKRGRQTTPIGVRSGLDARRDLAMSEVRAWKRAGGAISGDFLKVFADLHRLDVESLRGEQKGGHGGTRRKAARRKKYLKGK